MFAAGPSINEFEKRISGLRHADICYFGLNSFIYDKYILQQIDKHISVYMDSCCNNIPNTIKDIIDFLNRNEDNIFVSSFFNNTFGLLDGSFDLNQFLSRYDRRLILFSIALDIMVPDDNRPLHFCYTNSLLVLIQLAIIGNASRVVLFGADGYCEKNVEEYYYRPGEYEVMPRKYLIHDTKNFNSLAPIAINNVYKAYNCTPITILNCSEKSFYTPFPKVSYDDAFEYLLTGKEYDNKSDLRIPKVSVISRYLNTGDFGKETIENVSRQSYTNHEHIIIYDQPDDEMRGMVRQFPGVRWILEDHIEDLQALKKCISIARGDYICYCRIGDGYVNQEWINTCVEVLENDPDISLVWGLSQNMYRDGALGQIADTHLLDNPPPQKEYFIYYWLKQKLIFPKGNICVRKRVFEECFPLNDSGAMDGLEAWLVFNYRFNTAGYLPYFVPAVVNYSRTGSDILGDRQRITLATRDSIDIYYEDIEEYKRKLFVGNIIHCYRSGAGDFLAGSFSRAIYIFFDIGRQVKCNLFTMAIRVKSKLPDACCSVIEKILFIWRTYGWDAFRVVTVAVWNRLTGIIYTNNKYW